MTSTSSSSNNNASSTSSANKTSSGSISEPAAKRSRQPVQKHEDPFMYYSHQETRMNELLMRSDENNEEQIAREAIDRKSRISFELHPSLILEGLLDDIPDVAIER